MDVGDLTGVLPDGCCLIVADVDVGEKTIGVASNPASAVEVTLMVGSGTISVPPGP